MTNPVTNTMQAQELATKVEQIADEHGEVDDDERPTVTVEYETDHGNTRSRTGEVWNIDTDPFQWRDDTVVRFSANAGDTDEDPYYIAIRGDNAVLISISLQSDTETNLGDIENIDVEGLNADEDLPEITHHTEPRKQGGAHYIRCEGCNREVIGSDESRLQHKDDCERAGKEVPA